MVDCLIIGYNETNFEEDVKRMRAMGTNSISYKDLGLGYLNYENKPYRALDIFTKLYYENRDGDKRVFHNSDVLWQVIMYLGTCLNKNGFSYDYINLFHLEKEKLKEKLQKEDIRAIAITTTIYVSVHPILEVMSFIREYNKTAKIIVGGPYISKQCDEMDDVTNQSIFKLIGADFYVNSLEGEATLMNLLTEIKGEQRYDCIENIAYKSGEDYVFTPASREKNSLEDNMIDYSLFPKSQIGGTVNVRTSKSCPFSCAYCGFPLRAEKYTFVSPERVEKELNALRDLGCVKYINFIDDTFNIPRDRFKEILKMMIRNKYPFKWYSFYRCDFGDEEIIDLMREAGCIGVFLGVESANDGMLERMNKTSRLKHYLKAIPYLKQAGITLFVSTIIGFPGETYESAKETMDFIEDTKPDFFRPQIWWSDPLTPVWKKREEYGIRGLGFNWTHNTMDSKTAYDLFEKTFLSVENSIWVPDPGFNAYGMYYLLERGMTMDQVKTFLKCFNTAVKEKILYPERETVSAKVLEQLRKSCSYDRDTGVDIDMTEILPGSAYKEAERYWMKEFGEPRKAEPGRDEKSSAGGQEKTVSQKIGEWCLEAGDETEFRNTVLAAYGITLSRINILDNVNIVTAEDGKDALPVKLRLDESLTAGEFIRGIGRKLDEADPHRVYAFNIVANPVRLAEHNLQCPKLPFGFLETVNQDSSMALILAYHPDVYNGIDMVLRTVKTGNQYELVMDFKASAYTSEEIGKIGSYMMAILKILNERKDIALSDVKVHDGSTQSWIAKLEEEEFNF